MFISFQLLLFQTTIIANQNVSPLEFEVTRVDYMYYSENARNVLMAIQTRQKCLEMVAATSLNRYIQIISYENITFSFYFISRCI